MLWLFFPDVVGTNGSNYDSDKKVILQELGSSEEFIHCFTDESFVGWATFETMCRPANFDGKAVLVGQRQQLTEAG